MIKKILLIIFVLSLALSCGKKADPEYKAAISGNPLNQPV